MISSNSYYKGIDLSIDDNLKIMKNYFNPYEYNIESCLKDKYNEEISKMRSVSHTNRNNKTNNK
jgi:hypothetical protein